MDDRIRPHVLGGLVGIPFAMFAAAATDAVFSATRSLGPSWVAEFGQWLAPGPVGPPAAAAGVLLASVIVGSRLAEPWADRLAVIIRWMVLAHATAGVVAIGLSVVGGATDVTVAPIVLAKVAGTFVAMSWLYAIGGAFWAAMAGRLIRRDAPATPDEQAATASELSRLVRRHVKDDATIMGNQGSTARRWRD
jgi:hypothetical protein